MSECVIFQFIGIDKTHCLLCSISIIVVRFLHFTLILQRSNVDLTEFQFSFCFVKSVLCEI